MPTVYNVYNPETFRFYWPAEACGKFGRWHEEPFWMDERQARELLTEVEGCEIKSHEPDGTDGYFGEE